VAFSIRAHLSLSRFPSPRKGTVKIRMLAPQKSEKLRFLPVKRWEIRFLRSTTTPSAPAQHFVCACPSQGLCIFYKATHFLISLTPRKSRFLLICARLLCIELPRNSAALALLGTHTPHCVFYGPVLTMKGHVNAAHCFDCVL
jgi:hypothetical protein